MDSVLGTILGVIILLLFALVGVYISLRLKKAGVLSDDPNKVKYSSDINVSRKNNFMHNEMFKFYMIFADILPAEFVIFPKIRIEDIVNPSGNFDAYKKISNMSVDYVVFKVDGLNPVCAIDLINSSVATIGVAKQEEIITKALEKASIPILSYTIEKEYDKNKMLADFLDTQDIYTIMELKKNRKR